MPPARAPNRAFARMGRVWLTQVQTAMPRATRPGLRAGSSAASACACAAPAPAGGRAASVLMPCTLGRADDPGIRGGPRESEVAHGPPDTVVAVRVAVEAVHQERGVEPRQV